jgi:hypothetical protein
VMDGSAFLFSSRSCSFPFWFITQSVRVLYKMRLGSFTHHNTYTIYTRRLV